MICAGRTLDFGMRNSISLTYVGHATVLIEIDGMRILTDPVLGKHIGRFIQRHTEPPTGTASDVDLVLLSHLHWDHFNVPSLQLVGRHIPIIAPSGTADFLARRGFTNVQELQIGEQMRVGDIGIEATPAAHRGTRPPLGPEAECLGYLLRGSQTIYFAGDTDLFAEMGSLHDALDVALLPVWGWGPTLGSGHLDPRRAAEALSYLAPRVAVPIHWGTFYPVGLRWLLPRHLSGPPLQFAYHARELAPDVAVQIVQPGEMFEVMQAIETINS